MHYIIYYVTPQNFLQLINHDGPHSSNSYVRLQLSDNASHNVIEVENGGGTNGVGPRPIAKDEFYTKRMNGKIKIYLFPVLEHLNKCRDNVALLTLFTCPNVPRDAKLFWCSSASKAYSG